MKRGLALLLVVLAAATAVVAAARHQRRKSQLSSLPAIAADGVSDGVRTMLIPLREAVVAAPLDSDAWGALGSAFLANDMYSEAGACFERAEQLSPTNSTWPHLRGLCLFESDRLAAASAFRKAVELEPEQAESIGRLSDVLIEENQDEEAARLLSDAETRGVDSPQIQFNLARLDQRRGRFEKSLERLQKLIDADGFRADVRRLAAQANQQLGRTAEADRQAAAARALSKRNAANQWPDNILTATGRYKRDLRWRASAATTMARSGSPDRALDFLNELPSTDREDLRIQTAVADCQILLRRWDEAEKTLAAVLVKDPRNTGALFELGTLAMSRGQWKNAAEHFARATEFDPSLDVAHLNSALCQQRLGRPDLAAAALEKALTVDPANVDALRLLGLLSLEKGDRKEAKRRIDEALLFRPNDAALKELVARVGGS